MTDTAPVTIVSVLEDNRIHATSILLEMTFRQYLRLVSGAEENLSIQRNVVKSFKPYQRLREDLAQGCLIPAPVLAVREGALRVPKAINSSNRKRFAVAAQAG